MTGPRELRELPYEARARIADNLFLRRLGAEYSHADLSKRAMLSQSRIKQLEDGEIGGQLDTYVRLAGALGITVADLLAGVRWTPAAIQREVQAGYEVVFEVDNGDD